MPGLHGHFRTDVLYCTRNLNAKAACKLDCVKLFIEKALYPAMELKKGNRVRTYLAELQNTQTAEPDALHALQAERLKKLLHACADGVPAYRGLLTHEAIDEDPFVALRALPVLEKRTFRESPERYLNENYDASARIANTTGGSTGAPMQFYMDRFSVEHYEAARWRGMSWWGVTPGSRSVMLWGNPIELSQNEQKKARLKERYLKNRVVLSAYEMTPERTGEYIAFLNRYQPEYFYGYAGAIETFARLLAPRRDELHLKRLKVVVSTSETLHDAQRELISGVFGCPVANEYGARDAGILAFQCPCGKLHMVPENVLLELVDPVTHEPVRTGNSGLVVTTDLNNLAQPRLRFLLGDTATLSDEACTCGLGLPVMQSIDGREDAIFKLPDGRLIHGVFSTQLAKHYPSIEQIQLVQHDAAHAELFIVSTGAQPGEIASYARQVRDVLQGVELTVREVADIPKTGSGKTRYAIREFPL